MSFLLQVRFKFLFDKAICPKMRGIPHFLQTPDSALLLHAEDKEAIRAYTCCMTGTSLFLFPKNCKHNAFLFRRCFSGWGGKWKYFTYVNFFLLLHFCNKSYEKLQHFSFARQLYINFCLMKSENWKSEIGKWNSISLGKVLGVYFLFHVCAV